MVTTMSESKTTVRLTAADQRNIKVIMRQGYAATITGAIRAGLAHLAQKNGNGR